MLLIALSSCNKEWESEQYKHYISFKAPLNGDGVTPIHIPYNPKGVITYELPLIVSGSTDNNKSLTVHVALDPDTLAVFNYKNFQDRTDLYYKQLADKYFSIPETVNIKDGKNTAIMNIDLTLEDINLVEKWILPLTIVDNSSYKYTSNPRRNYSKALLRIVPFNDYSGNYSATAYKIYLKGYENGAAIVKNKVKAYVVDDHSIFFYAGNVNEKREDRGNYKIYARFNDTTKEVILTSDNPTMEFSVNKTARFTVEEVKDELRPYLLHRYVTISNIDYNFTDYTTSPGAKISYTVRGSLILQRDINTQIPDRDQAIEW